MSIVFQMLSYKATIAAMAFRRKATAFRLFGSAAAGVQFLINSVG
jgi:hypothetical protein